MCSGLIVAMPDETVEALPSPQGSDMTIWPTRNPWVHLAIGIGCRTFLVGDGYHCSCGRVRSAGQGFVLDGEASSLIADTADAYGQVAFVIHWFGEQFDIEEFLTEPGGAITSDQLRSGHRAFPEDQLVWVAGRNRSE